MCPELWELDNGEFETIDFGRPFEFAGAGEEDPVLEKGLPRFCGDVEDMMMCSV